jgi:tape measure domain-containing protein
MRQVQGSLNQTAGAVNSSMGMFKQFALGQIVGTYALQGLNAALGFAKDSVFGFNASLEQANIGFTTMLGSAEAATKMLDDLKKFAAATPFRFEGLLDSSKRLLAMGYTAEEIIPVMRTVGDAVAGLGAGEEGIQRATYALGQMKTAGRVLSQDMMQLTSLGVPAWDYLAQAIGKTTPEVRKMVEQGLIPAELGINAILVGMEKDFGGLMAKQAQTFTGALSNISDMLQQIVATGFQPFFEEVSKAAVSLAAFLQSSAGIEVMNNLKTIVGQVVDVMKTIVPAIFGVIGALAGFVAANPWIMGLVGAFIALKIALWGLSIIGAVVGLLQGMAGALGAVRAAFAVAGATTGFSTLLYAMSPALWGIVTAAGSAATAVWGFTAALLANPLTWIALAVVGVTALILNLGNAFDTTGEQAARSAEMTTDAWKESHSYLTSYNATAVTEAQTSGTTYGAAYAAGVTGTGPAQYAAGSYIAGEAARGLTETGVPAAAAAGQVVGATFGKEMQSAAMVSFRAGEKDISGVMTDNASAAQKALEEAIKNMNMANANAAFNKKVGEAFSIKPEVLRRALQAGLGGLSGDLLAIANGAISDLYQAQVSQRFADSLKPKGKAIYEGFVDLKTQMVRGAEEAVARAKEKLDQLKGVLQGLKDQMKAYAADIKATLMRGLGLSGIDMTAEFKEVTSTVTNVIKSTMNGIARTITETTNKITLEPILKDANYVVDQFKQRVDKMKEFIKNLAALRAGGINKTVLSDIMGMGVEEGGAMAAALAGNNAAIGQINALQAQAEAMAGAFGNMMGQAEFGAQISAADKAVGRQQRALDRAEAARDEALAFDPIQATLDALAALNAQNQNAANGTGRGTNSNRGGGNTSTTNNGPAVTVSNLNVGIPTVAGYGAGEQAMDRAMAAKIAQQIAAALSQISAVSNSGYILK